MIQALQPGGNTTLTSFNGTVTVTHSISPDSDIDLTAFLLTENNKVQGDSGIVFFNQPQGPNGVATYFPIQDYQGIRTHRIDFDLSKVPEGINRIAVTLTEASTSNFGNVKNLKALVQSAGVVYELNPAQLSIEKGIVVLELYLRGKDPKLRSSWQGFASGLNGLCEHFGVEVSDEPVKAPLELEPVASIANQTKNEQSHHVNEKKMMPIELQKGQKINLEKKTGAGLGEILINLNWNQTIPKRGLFNELLGSKPIDLDLGCLYEMKNGNKRCVQALGKAFGSFNTSPFIKLDGDDRTGSSMQGENLRINGKKLAQIKRVLIYTFIYGGVSNWQQVDGVVTVKCPQSQDIIVRLDENKSKGTMCAIAMLENKNDETFSVEKIVKFFNGHQQMDRAFGWGLNWSAGRK